MRSSRMLPGLVTALALVACTERTDPGATTGPAPEATRAQVGVSAFAPAYAIEFVSTAATATDLNDGGDVVGTSYRDTGCGSFCLPPQDIVIWKGGVRTVLPLVAGQAAQSHFPTYLNNAGLIGGTVGIPGSSTHAAVWFPGAGTYTVQDLGNFAGTSSTEVGGLDEQGRLLAWSTQGGAIPSLTVPVLWTQANGMVDLRTQGFPNEKPVAVSPNGTVLTTGHWYKLGNPASIVTQPAPPAGFFGSTLNGAVINDNGDQALFLPTTGGQNLRYPFRLPAGGTWQQLSAAGTGNLTRAGVGTINDAQDVTLTIQSTGAIADGPLGLAQGVASRITPSYGGATVSGLGPMNASGQILANAFIGRSPRVVKLVPVSACGANCAIASVVVTSTFVQDPANPGSCFQGGKMYNSSTVRVTVTDELGNPVANATVSGRFLDDYWTDSRVSGTTNASGVMTAAYQGLCGVGAIAFLVDNVASPRTLDRTRGLLTAWVIPSVGPPPGNQPPVANFTVSCNRSKHSCTLDARSSTDDGGLANLSFTWTAPNQPTKSGAVITRSCQRRACPVTVTETLTATDAGGLTASTTKTYTIP